MSLDLSVLLAIIGMSVVTYATRAGGYVLFRVFPPTASVRTLLSYIPGTLFVSYVVPGLGHGSWPEWFGAAAAVAIMVTTRQMSAAIVGGTAVAWLVWGWS